MGVTSPNPKKARRRAGDANVAQATPPAPPAKGLARLAPHAYLLPVLLAVMLGLYWMVTFGTGRLLVREDFAWFYDVQAKSLLHGHWDVPYDAITFESFVRGGKYYMYFGPVPAVARLPLEALAPSWEGRWSRLSMLAAAGVSLACAYLLLVRLRGVFRLPEWPGRGAKVVYACFVVSAGLGSTLLFLCCRSYVYHEAIIWGGAFALACYYCLVRYLAAPTRGRLLAACGFCFLAFNTRAPVGGGAVLALLLLAANVAAARWRLPPHRRYAGGSWLRRLRLLPALPAALNRWNDPPPYRHALLAAAGALLAVTAYVSVNYARFGTLLNATPMWMYTDDLLHPKPQNGTGGGMLNVANLRSGLYAYLAPDQVGLRHYFPWVIPVPPQQSLAQTAESFPEARYRHVEPYASLTATAPALLGLALAGLFAARRRFESSGSCATIPLLGALAGAAVVFTAEGLSERYLHEGFPFLVLSAALGVNLVLALRRPETRLLVWLLAAPLALWGLWASFAVAIVFQRVIIYGVPGERQQQFLRWKAFMDEHVSARLFDEPKDGAGGDAP